MPTGSDAWLRSALSQEFCVGVECPLHHRDRERIPHFIVLTTFGVVILEVKDWVYIVSADKFYAQIRTRSG